MRIHANEDVYETTRARMATIEENVKNKWWVKIIWFMLHFLGQLKMGYGLLYHFLSLIFF